VPELPEAETLAQDIDAAARGRTITRVDVIRRDVLKGVTPASLRRRLTGARIERVWRRAKAVVIDVAGGEHLVVGLGFTGGIVVDRTGAAADPYDTMRFTLANRRGALVFRDVRRLGRIALLNDRAFAAYDRRIGLEPLGPHFTGESLSAFIRGSAQAIKKLIMDQRRLAGVGNIYANEALWMARIDPSRPGRRVNAEEGALLRDAIVDVLDRAIAARGTTFRDFRDSRGERGQFVFQLAAYGREGEPCRRCGTRLVMTHAIDGRATVFCHRCQR
jgi:formamidopyrimidine-DNA glycosylase